jgi:riboflavin synthase
MFTGLIEATGTIERIDAANSGRRVCIATALGAELRPGDSIAVNGVCLTVTAADARGFFADVSPETLRVTSLGRTAVGRRVNLERPLRADGRVGGHFVLGHVDAVGRIHTLRREGECHWLEVEAPAALAPVLVPKGSIAVDGVSLTVASLQGARFGMQIVPFTWEHTALADLSTGDSVNLEADVIGKYVVRLLETRGVA